MPSSLWLDTAERPPETSELTDGATYDVIVVGAGLTGVVAALLLARSGLDVLVVEARGIGSVASGNTTGKLSLLQGNRYSSILEHNAADIAAAYLAANREGQSWLTRYLDDHGVLYERRNAVTYAETREGKARLQREREACGTVGLDVRVARNVLPFGTNHALVLEDQVQFHPLDVLYRLATDAIQHGATIVVGTRVVDIESGEDRCRVETAKGSVSARAVILATGTPILNNGEHFARLEPHRSYLLSFETDQPAVDGMYLSLDDSVRSLRTATRNGRNYLLVGGSGHVVGRVVNTARRVSELEAWTLERFPEAVLTNAWSSQDYAPIGSVPFVGRLSSDRVPVFVATGFDKWGMTNAVAAALMLSEEILGGSMWWADALRNRSGIVSDFGGIARLGAQAGWQTAKGWTSSVMRARSLSNLDEGDGYVESSGVHPVARCKVGGEVRSVSAVCTHLGGIVSWNNAESSWDCPLHGSRFAPDGEVLEGPARRGLEPMK